MPAALAHFLETDVRLLREPFHLSRDANPAVRRAAWALGKIE